MIKVEYYYDRFRNEFFKEIAVGHVVGRRIIANSHVLYKYGKIGKLFNIKRVAIKNKGLLSYEPNTFFLYKSYSFRHTYRRYENYYYDKQGYRNLFTNHKLQCKLKEVFSEE